MRTNTFTSSTLGLLASLAAPIAAQDGPYFTLGSGMPVVLDRLDPLLSAGKVSNHVHSVVGGNGFAPSMNFAQTQKSTCSTIAVKADLSNYWMPALYYKSPHNGSFFRVPEQPYHKLYYKYGTHDSKFDLEQSEFPQEFRMMTGDAMLRSDDGSFGSGGNQLNWQCHQPNYVTPQGTGFPKFTSCNGGGLAATMRFPSCWNGKPFDPQNPRAHMAFPINQDGLKGCQAPFNVKRFPEIMIEYWLNTKQFDGDYTINDSPWVLAQGDNTGYGFHMDFINGWKTGVLGKAIKSCFVGNTADPLDSDSCFGAGSLRSGAEQDACRTPNIIPEDVGLADPSSKDGPNTKGGELAHLPGCNPIQPGPGLASIQTGCTWSYATSFVAGADLGSQVGADVVGLTGSSNAASKSTTTLAKSTTSSTKASTSSTKATSTQQTTSATQAAPSSSSSTGSTITPSDGSTWELQGCYVDQLSPVRSLGTSPEWWGQAITNSNCVAHCSQKGTSLAGTENGGQCFCGNSLVGSKQTASSDCKSPCSGDSTQTCGGPARLTVYKKTSSKKVRKHRHLARHVEAVS